LPNRRKRAFVSALVLCALGIVVSGGELGHRGNAATYDYGNKFTRVRKFDNVRGSDLSSIDGVITSDILKTLTFDAATKWPAKSKMPGDITPDDLIEYGKDPGLGVR